jgi:hypothetical protein
MRRFYLFIVAICIAAAVLPIVRATPPSIGPGFYDDRMGVAEYAGTWLQDSNANNFFSTGTYTTVVWSLFTLNFYGDGFTLFYVKCTTCGDFQVLVDDLDPILIDSVAGSTLYKQTLIVTGLGSGLHELVMQKIESNTEVVFWDAILIHAAPPATPAPTFDYSAISVELTLELTLEVAPPAWINEFTVPDGEGGEQNVAFSYEVTAGDLSQVILIAATLIAVLVLLVVTVRGST